MLPDVSGVFMASAVGASGWRRTFSGAVEVLAAVNTDSRPRLNVALLSALVPQSIILSLAFPLHGAGRATPRWHAIPRSSFERSAAFSTLQQLAGGTAQLGVPGTLCSPAALAQALPTVFRWPTALMLAKEVGAAVGALRWRWVDVNHRVPPLLPVLR